MNELERDAVGLSKLSEYSGATASRYFTEKLADPIPRLLSRGSDDDHALGLPPFLICPDTLWTNEFVTRKERNKSLLFLGVAFCRRGKVQFYL